LALTARLNLSLCFKRTPLGAIKNDGASGASAPLSNEISVNKENNDASKNKIKNKDHKKKKRNSLQVSTKYLNFICLLIEYNLIFNYLIFVSDLFVRRVRLQYTFQIQFRKALYI